MRKRQRKEDGEKIEMIKKLTAKIQTRIGFIGLLVGLLWVKNMLAFALDLKLTLENPLQYFILLINPIATTLFLLGIALYIRRKIPFYVTSLLIYTVMSILLYANVSYFREFTDFLTVNTMLGTGKVSSGLGDSALKLLKPYDILFFADIFILVGLLISKKFKMQATAVKGKMAFATTAFAVMLFSGNLLLAETDRPELLTRTFSNAHLVKYLGVNAFTAYDGIQTYKTNQVRAQASPTDLDEVIAYKDEHYAAPDEELFGLAKGKNVIYLHLESTQQFLIDYKLKDEATGEEREVLPFINQLYHDQSTFSFDNFFHQVKAGKTSDAETLMDNSLFGLDQGALFVQLGGKNTFQSGPMILNQTQGYTSAVFHGNVGSFWNRNETYKHFGYDYFFDDQYYDVTKDNSFQYGLHDDPLLVQSEPFLEALPQPFYTKMLMVTNHFPYTHLSESQHDFPLATTDDSTINGYFRTANYMDQSVEAFFDYLKSSGLYENSVIVLYGDHYGISNSRNKTLAPLLGIESQEWTNYDNAQVQRVPYMIHVPGATQGGINHTYGGQVDALPTLLHLLGEDTKDYLVLGQDLLSEEHDDFVTFRDGSFMTPEYTYYGRKVYDNQTQQVIETPSETQETEIVSLKAQATAQLENSDQINNGDLLRFYTDHQLDFIDPSEYDYLNQTNRLGIAIE